MERVNAYKGGYETVGYCCSGIYGGAGWPRDVAKYIWNTYETEIRRSDSLLYTWQYDVRWTAMAMRKEGVLKAVGGRTDKPWELVLLSGSR